MQLHNVLAGIYHILCEEPLHSTYRSRVERISELCNKLRTMTDREISDFSREEMLDAVVEDALGLEE